MIRGNHEEKTEKEVQRQKFFVCAYNFQDFAQLHDRETVTFKKSTLQG